VPRGSYKVEIAAKGFQSETVLVTITLSATQNLIFKLNPSGGSTTVEVTAAAPLVDASDAVIGATIQGAQVTELPLNGRNFSQLALLTPGVTRGAYGDVASGGGSSNNTETMRNNESGAAAISVNGLRPQADNYILDGVDNNDAGQHHSLLPQRGCDAGVQGEHQRGSGRVWPGGRRDCGQLAQTGNQPISRRGILVLSRQELRLEQ
jgi:hypothetical protein